MISLFDALFLGVIALFTFYVYMTWNFNYWKKRGIESDNKPSILFGSLTDAILGKKPLGAIFCDLYDKFPGKKVVGFYKFREPGLMIKDPEIVRKILISNFNSFRNNDVTLDAEADPIMGTNLFILRDDLWKKKRSLLTPAFTMGKIKAIYPVMTEVAKDFLKYLQQHPEELQVKPVMSRYTSEVVARCALGIDGNNFKHANPEMHEMGKLIWEPDFVKGFKMMAMFIMPKITKLLRLQMVPNKVVEFFNGVLRDVIIYRQQHNIERNDLVQYFIGVKNKSQAVAKGAVESDVVSGEYTDNDILSGCVTFFVEGYETTALSLNNTLYQLALHKDKQEKLKAEIDEVLSEGELTLEKLHNMPYLQSVISETIRLYPVLFHSQKLCTSKYEIDIGKGETLVVEEGTPIVIPVYKLQRDPLYWEDADKFIPERFLENGFEAEVKSKGIYLPFSEGPRMCPGMRIALTMMKLALVNILSELEVQPTSKTPKEIDPDPQNMMLAHKGGIYLRFVPRSK